MDGYTTAPELIPRLVWLGKIVTIRHQDLVDFRGCVNGAASVAIRAEETMEEAAQNHRWLAAQRDTLLEKARSLLGFEDFLRPKKFATLSKATRAGSVVVINVTH